MQTYVASEDPNEIGRAKLGHGNAMSSASLGMDFDAMAKDIFCDDTAQIQVHYSNRSTRGDELEDEPRSCSASSGSEEP